MKKTKPLNNQSVCQGCFVEELPHKDFCPLNKPKLPTDTKHISDEKGYLKGHIGNSGNNRDIENWKEKLNYD